MSPSARAVPWLLAIVATTAAAQGPAVPVRSALEPASTGGIEVVDRALAKLATHRRLLVVGAHPDDEDTSLLTLVSRGMGGEAAYLALSRGDGGQNLIGTELGEGLGLLRTRELEAARDIDGAHQYFTRAFDFGYTRSLEETLRRWPRDVLVADVARVVRRFRPQVIVAMFSSEIGGHGQHLASGWAAERVMETTGDPASQVELAAEGLSTWRPAALYRRAWFDPERASFEQEMDLIEGLSGRSVLQIAMHSRSQHRSQDMGTLQPLGSRDAGLERVVGPADAEELFDGVDTRLEAIVSELAEGSVRRGTSALLAEVSIEARRTRASLAPSRLAAAAAPLAKILARLRRVDALLAGDPSGPARAARRLVGEKIGIATAGLLAAAAIGIDATSDAAAVAPGGSTELVVEVWNAGELEVELLGVEISASESWSVEPRERETPNRLGVEERGFTAHVAVEAAPSVPYFLKRPRVADLYDWSAAAPELRGLPYQGPELEARLHLGLTGRGLGEVELVVEREVVERLRDQALGEVRRPIRIVPRLEVSVRPSLLLWDLDATRPRPVEVTLRSHLDGPVAGRVEGVASDGWEVAAVPFAIDEARGAAQVELAVAPPPGLASGRHRIDFVAAASAEVVGAFREGMSVPLLEYPHIRPAPLPVAASLEISAFDLALPEVGAIGYVRGASDALPELLERLGLEVELLDADELTTGGLSRFRVIVIGSRAYETVPALATANPRLLGFVEGGGRLIVQYQQYQYVRGGFAPFDLDITRPHGRITDETAPPRLLEPDHPVFTAPNQLTAADWVGWVQERGLYFADTWGEEFAPLLAFSDPGMEEQRGGLLVARHGEGLYVYTGLAFFRQLPAGVAGAYRLFMNLLALE